MHCRNRRRYLCACWRCWRSATKRFWHAMPAARELDKFRHGTHAAEERNYIRGGIKLVVPLDCSFRQERGIGLAAVGGLKKLISHMLRWEVHAPQQVLEARIGTQRIE